MKSTNTIKPKQVLKAMWSYIRPYRFTYLFVLFEVCLASSVDIFVPVYYKRFFDLLTGGISVESSQLASSLIGTITIVLLFHCAAWIFWRSSAFIMTWLQPRICADIVQSCHAKLHSQSFGFFLDSFTGSIVRKVGRFERAYEALSEILEYKFLPLLITIVGYLFVLYSQHYLLAVIMFVWLVVYLVFHVFYSMWKLKYDSIRAKTDSEASGVLADSISNAVTVKLFTGFSFEKNLFKEVTERLRKIQTFCWNLAELTDAIQAGLMIAIEFALMYYAIKFWQQGLLTIGDFALIQGYLVGLFGKLWDLGHAIRKTYEAFADASEMVEILEAEPDVMDVRNAKPLDPQNGRIEFRDVYFNFNETRPILKGLNLMIEPGEKVGLVGPSGAGKSTIAKLLLRLYDLDRGKIIVGNQNIARVTQESLRSQIAVVPQEPILFHRTIMDNLRYGRRDATDEEVISAAKKAQCHDFISELHDGYETFVGERGVKLSGGERQRVAIARAILKNVSILVLDEATSSLDSASEALIQTALHELMEGRTTIVIAHRLSTIMEMDRIVVVDNGRVVDEGTHEQLLRHKKGIYKNLWEIQAGGFMQ